MGRLSKKWKIFEVFQRIFWDRLGLLGFFGLNWLPDGFLWTD